MKNYLTFEELDSKCLHLAGLNENDLKPAVRQVIINDFIHKHYGLLNGVNDPWWNRTLPLTVVPDIEFLKDSANSGGVVSAIDSTAKTITRTSSTFPAGALLDISIWTSAGAFKAQWKARVTVAGATATYVTIAAGTEATLGATDRCTVTVQKKLSVTSIDVSSSYVKKVVKVYDDQGPSNKERVFDEYKDPVAFGNVHTDPFMKKRIAWYHRGDAIELIVGTRATAPGQVQAEVVAKPKLFTDATATEAIDIPPEENQMLTDEVVAEYLRRSGKAIPDDVASRLAIYEKRYQAAAMDRAKAEEMRGQRS